MRLQKPTWVPQGSSEITVKTGSEEIFAILENSQRLPQWMPPVKSTSGHMEALGSVRKCEVNFEGRNGYVVEECVVFDRPRRIGWHLREDSIGFSKMLQHFSFDFVLRQTGPAETRIVYTSYFEPRNLFSQVMIALMLRRKFGAIRQRVLENIRRLAETKKTH